jgi:hypothetical protein
MTIRFEPSLYNAYYMYQDYANSSLLLDMGLHITGKLTLWGWQLSDFDNEFLPTTINCNAASARSLCKCPAWV